jgi:hypothetical protein
VLVFAGDKVKESRIYFDMLNLLQEIGATAKRGGFRELTFRHF